MEPKKADHQVNIVRLGEPRVHTNADSLELFDVQGYQVVTRKGTFKAGDCLRENMSDKSVFQEWLQDISWKQQTVIVTGLRGCDGLSKYDPSKHISRSIRMAALKNADTTTTYMKHNVFEELLESADKFVGDLDKYPVHFVLHMAHACEIIGYKHPDAKFRETFSAIYNRIVWAMHLRPESKESMEHRLSDKK